MSSFQELFNSLRGGSNAPLSPALMDENIRRLRDVRIRSGNDDLRDGAPRCNVKVVGDPEIIDAQGRVYHYYGPSLLVNLDDRGMVRSLEFVGVKSDNDYISEVWHLDVRTGRYKYRNLSNMQGRRISCYDTDEPQFQAGDGSWNSEVAPDAVPPRSFLQKFKPDSETFFVDCRSGMFVRGPPFGLLKSVIESPSALRKSLFASCSQKPDVWMLLAADVTKRHSSESGAARFAKPCREMQAVQVAQLVYGLTACVAA
eukprot:TRINITY_DN36353_c0_g1_i1.p1 TRINITY_DN36353_c0_g1~~TRINITY_DN36353_c0_g1_i1.p1  ORF type:complete len:257 (-),score=35.68 TRINITY_DN36353_c0_g1_i1:97-867(-)